MSLGHLYKPAEHCGPGGKLRVDNNVKDPQLHQATRNLLRPLTLLSQTEEINHFTHLVSETADPKQHQLCDFATLSVNQF